MAKYFLPNGLVKNFRFFTGLTIVILCGLILLIAPSVQAAFDTLTFNGNTTIELEGLSKYLTVKDASMVESMIVYSTYMTVVMKSGSTITITSSDREELGNDFGIETNCYDSYSELTINATEDQTTDITLAGTCTTPAVAGGSAPPAPAAPVTVTEAAEAPAEEAPAEEAAEVTVTEEAAEVTEAAEEAPTEVVAAEATVTVEAGGEAEATTEEGGKAEITVPVEAVAAEAQVTITPTQSTAASVAAQVAAAPSGKEVVGNYVYNYSIESAGEAVTTLAQEATVTFSYTEAQIAGLDADTLTIHYYNEATSEWVGLESRVDRTNMTVTASTAHFTLFALFAAEAEEEVVVVAEEEEEEEVVAEKPITEMTVEELKAKIQEILQKILQLKALLVELQGGAAIEGIPAGFKFTSVLKQGVSSTEVKYMQIVLNSSVDTRLAATGVGSPGHETTYFGSLTTAAVIKFQEKYATSILAPWGFTNGTGYVGKTTRAKLNELIGN